jgi:hypothetical protein
MNVGGIVALRAQNDQASRVLIVARVANLQSIPSEPAHAFGATDS